MIGLFHSDWLGCRPGRVSYWPTGGRGRDGKNPASPPHYRGELSVDFTGFLDSAEAELSRDTPPHLPVVQLLHSSADPGQTTLNVYMSHILI
jgi:hypothetical protein